MNRKEIEKKWRLEGFSCETWVDPPGQHWDNFIHETEERLFLVDGKLELEVEGKVHTLNAGDEAVIPAGTLHSVRNTGASMARWLYGYRYNH